MPPAALSGDCAHTNPLTALSALAQAAAAIVECAHRADIGGIVRQAEALDPEMLARVWAHKVVSALLICSSSCARARLSAAAQTRI